VHFQGAAALVLALVLTVLGAIASPEVSAHATLIQSDPADKSVVAEAPHHLHLKFNEPVSALALRLVAADGTATTLDRFTLNDTTLTIDTPAGLADGTFVLSFRVVSEDGHPVAGSVLFSVGAPSAGAIAGVDAVDPVSQAAVWAFRVALYLGLFLGAGGAVFHGTIATVPLAAKRTSEVFVGIGLVAAVGGVGLQGLDALGLPISSIWTAEPWSVGFETSFGRTAVIAVLALCMGFIALRASRRSARTIFAVLALIGVGGALAASGHASAASPEIVTRPAVFIHAAAITFWVGSLLPLGLLLWKGGPEANRILRRYGRTILPVFIALIAVGLFLSIIQLDYVSALWTTAYGVVFLVKLGLVVGLLALAALNRFRLTPAFERGDRGARRRFGSSIAAETVLVVVILAVAATWRFTPPPRAIAQAAEAAAIPASVHMHSPKVMANLLLEPGRAGPVTATIEVMDAEANPFEAKEITLLLGNETAGIEPLKRKATRSAEGVWRIEDLTIPLGGRWAVRLDILISDFEKAMLEETVEIE